MDDDNTLELADGRVLKYKTLVAFKCTYCGKNAKMVDIEGMGFSGLHDRPECSEFIAMDALDYLRSNRKRLQKTQAMEAEVKSAEAKAKSKKDKLKLVN